MMDWEDVVVSAMDATGGGGGADFEFEISIFLK